MATLQDQLNIEPVPMQPRAIFGFNGKVHHGIFMHPNRKHLIYPIGTKISILCIENNQQQILTGHSHDIYCLDVSASGKYIASGQTNYMGFPGYVILWDFEKRQEVGRHSLHKKQVQSLCITAQDKFVVSIGGQDDGSVIVFDIATNTPLCRSNTNNAISGPARFVRAMHHKPAHFICCGRDHMRFWSIDREHKKMNVTSIQVGKNHRIYTGLRIDCRDEYAFLGTMTGDIVKVVINCCDLDNVTKVGHIASLVGSYGIHNPKKPFGKDCLRFVNGVRDIVLIGDGLLLVGAGDGTIQLVEERKDVTEMTFRKYPEPTVPLLKTLKSTKVNGVVSSMVKLSAVEYYIATENSELYMLNIKTFDLKLLKTCHTESVNHITFPKGNPAIFATAGYESIRIWSVKRLQELLRIMVYNFHCASLSFTRDGSSIVSVWNDGIIRAFTPITGRLIYAIPNAHNKGCSALAVSADGRILITGGREGQVRKWKIEPFRQSLVAVKKEHSGRISTLHFNSTDSEVISASVDGSCIIWDTALMARKRIFTANTEFMSALYLPHDLHVLTCGSDGGISYWLVYNGSLIREIEGSRRTSVNALAINSNGDSFVSVGSDQLVKLWDYNRGIVLAIGSEHASAVNSVVYSPCGKFIVTGSSAGGIIIWDIPQQFWGPRPELPPIDVLTPKPSKTKLRGGRSNNSINNLKENIEALLANTAKNDLCCVECPPVDAGRKQRVEDECTPVVTTKKC